MQSNLRQAAIQAIKNGNLNQLRAIKEMIGSDGHIPVYYQVLGELELYSQSGELVSVTQSEPEVSIDGILPLVSSVVVTFSSIEEMKKILAEGKENESVLTH